MQSAHTGRLGSAALLMGKMPACGYAGFCGLLVWQKVKCANPNTIANLLTPTLSLTLTLTLSLTLHPNPTNPKLHARIPAGRRYVVQTLPYQHCPLEDHLLTNWKPMKWREDRRDVVGMSSVGDQTSCRVLSRLKATEIDVGNVGKKWQLQ